jgi:hypothetical protein
MKEVLKYRGRIITDADVAFIRQLIADNRQASRWRLSKFLCEAWDWRQVNGVLCDMICRGMMLQLHRAGHIKLPPRRLKTRNYLAERKRIKRPAVIQLSLTDQFSHNAGE